MSKNNMTYGLVAGVVATFTVLSVIGAPVAGVVADSFSEVASGETSVQYSPAGTQLSIAFPAMPTGRHLSIPPSSFTTVASSIAADSTAFTGDFKGAGVEGIAFRLGSTLTTSPSAVLRLDCISPTGRESFWEFRSLNVGTTAAPESNNIQLSEAAGWVCTSLGGGVLSNDLANVEQLSLNLQQVATPSQDAMLADVRLLYPNQVITPSAVLRSQLEAYFDLVPGEALNAAQLAQDSDGDGIPDHIEISMTETDPNDANSALRVRATRLEDQSLLLEWEGIVGSSYAVLHTPTPTGVFTPVAGYANMACDATGTMSVVLPYDGGKYFYTVQQVK